LHEIENFWEATQKSSGTFGRILSVQPYEQAQGSLCRPRIRYHPAASSIQRVMTDLLLFYPDYRKAFYRKAGRPEDRKVVRNAGRWRATFFESDQRQ
jgi:hypothetical protein